MLLPLPPLLKTGFFVLYSHIFHHYRPSIKEYSPSTAMFLLTYSFHSRPLLDTHVLGIYCLASIDSGEVILPLSGPPWRTTQGANILQSNACYSHLGKVNPNLKIRLYYSLWWGETEKGKSLLVYPWWVLHGNETRIIPWKLICPVMHDWVHRIFTKAKFNLSFWIRKMRPREVRQLNPVCLSRKEEG